MLFRSGSLCGGLCAGVLSKKLKAKNSYITLFYCALTLIPIGIAISINVPVMASYYIIVISCFIMMLLAAMFSIQMISYLQMIVPNHIIGKVISSAICIGMCASPIGQAIYGGLFQIFDKKIYIVIYAAAFITCLIAIISKRVFNELNLVLSKAMGKESV